MVERLDSAAASAKQWNFHQNHAVPGDDLTADEWRQGMDAAASKLPNLPAPGTAGWIQYMADYWDVPEEEIIKNGW